MKRALTLLLILAFGCEPRRPPSTAGERIAAAEALTRRYAQHGLAAWSFHGNAAGADCGVLFVQTAIIMDEGLVEALHRGTGPYAIYRGGVEQFSRDRAFRGVAYADRSTKRWLRGDVHESEPLTVCR